MPAARASAAARRRCHAWNSTSRGRSIEDPAKAKPPPIRAGALVQAIASAGCGSGVRPPSPRGRPARAPRTPARGGAVSSGASRTIASPRSRRLDFVAASSVSYSSRALADHVQIFELVGQDLTRRAVSPRRRSGGFPRRSSAPSRARCSACARRNGPGTLPLGRPNRPRGRAFRDMPQRVTIARARRVACSMSDEAPEVTLSWPKIEFFGHAPAHHDRHAREHLLARERQLIAFRQLHDHAQRAAARNDRRPCAPDRRPARSCATSAWPPS